MQSVKECLKIVKILNNNAVVCIDCNGNGDEKIIMGKGIAFGLKVGAPINQELIEKTFTLHNSETRNHFQKIIQEIPAEHILLAEKIISHAKKVCKKELHDSIYITLTDHISTALERMSNQIYLKNPLLPSIKRLYPEEYHLAKDALDIIKESTGVSCPDDEAGFITMHFINSELGPNNKGINTIVLTAEKIVEIVSQYLEKDIDEESNYWQRFITHISFLVERLIQDKEISSKDETSIFGMLKDNYPTAYQCALSIKYFLDTEFKCNIGEEELSYLIIHISRLQKE